MTKEVCFFSLKLGDEFVFQNNKYVKIAVIDGYNNTGLNLETYKVRAFYSNGPSISVTNWKDYYQERME